MHIYEHIITISWNLTNSNTHGGTSYLLKVSNYAIHYNY